MAEGNFESLGNSGPLDGSNGLPDVTIKYGKLKEQVKSGNANARAQEAPDLTALNPLAEMEEAKALSDLEKQLKAASDKVDQLTKLADTGHLAEAVEHNASWFSGQEGEEIVDNAVAHVVRATELLQKARDKVSSIESKIIETKQALYVKVYESIKGSGNEADAILLTAFDDLGEKIPQSLKSEVEAARARKVNDPNSTEFDKLFYSGKSVEALAVLAKSNNETYAVAGFNDDEIFKIYQETSKVQFGGGVQERRDAVKYRMKANSFGATKLREGYVALVLPGIDPYDEMTPTAIVKEKPDGSLSIYFVTQDGLLQGKEHVATPGNAATVETKNDEIQENFAKVFGKIPSFQRLGEAGKVLQAKFLPLQKLFVSGSNGKKTKDFANLAKGYARDLQESNAVSILRGSLPQVKKDLAILKALPAGYKGEFEAQIDQMEKALSQITELTAYGGMLDHFCEQVLNPAFSEDDLMSWWIKEGLTYAIAIGAAVVAVLTFGAGGLAMAALAGTIGLMAGVQVGHIVSEGKGEKEYGKGFSNKSTLGKYLVGEKMIDPVTGKLREIDGVDLAKEYGQEFVIGFISTYLLLGLGQLAGKALSKFAKANAASTGVKRDLASLINKIPRLQPQHVDLLSKRGLSHLTQRLGREYVQEIGEEAVEVAAQKCGVLSGFSASLYFALSPGRVKAMLGKHNVSADGIVVTDTGVVSNYSFDVNEAAAVTGKIEEGLTKQGFVVTRNSDGSVSCERTITLKDGTKMSNKLVFNPTTENLETRDRSVSFEAARPQIDALMVSLEAIAANDPLVRQQLTQLKADSRALMGDLTAAAESGRPISESQANGFKVRIGQITGSFAALLYSADAHAAGEWGYGDTMGLVAKAAIFSVAVLGGYAVFPTGVKMLDAIGLSYPSKFVLGKLQDITSRLQARPGTAPGDLAVQNAGKALDAKLKKIINGARTIEAELDDGSYDLLPFALIVRNITKTGNRMLAILDEATAAAAAGRPYVFPAEFATLKTTLDKHVAAFEKSLKQKGKIGIVTGVKVFAYVAALLTAMHIWAAIGKSKSTPSGAPAPAPSAGGRIPVTPPPAPATNGAKTEEAEGTGESEDGASDEKKTEKKKTEEAEAEEEVTVDPNAPRVVERKRK